MNRLLYALHKWISAIAFVQLAVWTVSGFTFTWITQDAIKSTPVEGANVAALSDAPPVTVARAMQAAAAAQAGAIRRIDLRGTPDGPVYVVTGTDAVVRVDARSGDLAPVDRARAEAIARRDQPGSPAAIDASLITEAPPIEYRDCESGDCPLPAFRVSLADRARTVVYVDARTGDVAARRNEDWRTYDFFWSLHIMDYRAREDFNHWLIRGAAMLAMGTVLTGTILLLVRATRWVRRFRTSRL